MAFKTVDVSTAESLTPDDSGVNLFMLKDDLDTEELGFSVCTLEPGEVGMEHEHAEDGQEEVYYVVEGGVDVVFGTETVSLDERDAIRIDSDEERQVKNRDHYSELVMVGAPR